MARSAHGFDAEDDLTGARRKIVPAVPARGSDAEHELTGARRKLSRQYLRVGLTQGRAFSELSAKQDDRNML